MIKPTKSWVRKTKKGKLLKDHSSQMRRQKILIKKKWPPAQWAVQQIFRDNGMIEDICEHGVGHPNRAWLEKYPSPHNGIHGCDGCCCKEKNEIHQTPP